MRKFVFPLQPLLNYRNHQVELAKAQLYQLLKERARLITVQSQKEAELRQIEVDLRAKDQFFSDEMRRYSLYTRRLQHELSLIMAQLEQIDHRLRGQRQELQRATQRQKVVEKLKQRRAYQHSLQLERLQQREADDLFLQRRAYNRPFD